MKQYLYVFNKKSNQINVSQNNNIIRKIIVNKTDNINSDNLEKTPKKSPLIDKFTSKPLSDDDKNYFNFKKSGWHLTIIYLITFVAIPIIYSLIKMYAFNTKIDELSKSKEFFYLLFLVPIFGFVLSLSVDWNTMIKKGGWAAYAHLLFSVIASIFIAIFLIPTKIISGKEDDSVSLATIFLVQQLFQLLGSGLVLLFCKPLRQKIITTLKEAKLDIISWVIIFAAIAEVLNFLLTQVATVKNLPFFTAENKSSNQNSLDSMKATTYGAIVLFISTTIFAPINEEISYRFGSFTIVRQRWLGFMASFIYFPAMHVMQNGDWANITGYLSLGFFLPLLFIMTRGNVTYTISLHAFCNLLANIYGYIHH